MIPEEGGHPFRLKVDRNRSEATLEFSSWNKCPASVNLAHGFSDRFSFQTYFVSIVNNPVQDGIGKGGITDGVMPFVYGQL